MVVKHTPYAGGQKGFTIGLSPLDIEDWFEVDGGLAERLAEKDRLQTAFPRETFAADPASLPAQTEVLDAMWSHLSDHHSASHKMTASDATIDGVTDSVAKDQHADAPLKTAARLVDEDLCIMEKVGEAWRLTAASLCFPSHWALADKFGRPMADIHGPVPGFANGMQARVARIMDNLQPDTLVGRQNWSLHDDAILHQTTASAHPRFDGLVGQDVIDAGFVRIERQTLRKMPRTGAILFTIRTYIDPLTALCPSHLEDLADAITAMDVAQLDYRGISHNAEGLVSALREAAKLALG